MPSCSHPTVDVTATGRYCAVCGVGLNGHTHDYGGDVDA